MEKWPQYIDKIKKMENKKAKKEAPIELLEELKKEGAALMARAGTLKPDEAKDSREYGPLWKEILGFQTKLDVFFDHAPVPSVELPSGSEGQFHEMKIFPDKTVLLKKIIPGYEGAEEFFEFLDKEATKKFIQESIKEGNEQMDRIKKNIDGSKNLLESL